MPADLKRYQGQGHLHFLTFSCRGRRPYLRSAGARDLFLDLVEEERGKRNLWVAGYVVMPEHVHMLVAEPAEGSVAEWLKTVKQRFARAAHRERMIAPGERVWEPRYYDFNVFTEKKRIEKLKYIHRNPVKRGLVESPEDWKWGSFRFYLLGESYLVRMSRDE